MYKSTKNVYLVLKLLEDQNKCEPLNEQEIKGGNLEIKLKLQAILLQRNDEKECRRGCLLA